jgi:hypothetical protein
LQSTEIKPGLVVGLFVVQTLTEGIMAKKNSKRREWTTADVRDLKALAGRKRQRGKLLGHLRGLRAQLDRRLLALEFRWIPVSRTAQ